MSAVHCLTDVYIIIIVIIIVVGCGFFWGKEVNNDVTVDCYMTQLQQQQNAVIQRYICANFL